MQTIGIDESTTFTRIPLRLKLYGNNNIDIALPKLPSPFHTCAGLLMGKGLTIKEKLAITSLFIQLYRTNFNLLQDCSIRTALQNLGQSEFLITNLWEPIALAIMSTPIDIASANVFLQVLKNSFTGKASNSDWLLPKQDLSQILPNPAYKYLSTHGANIILGQSIKELIYEEHRCIGVANDKGSWYADNIVLATPAITTAKLLTKRETQHITTNLSKITYNSITTIYLIFAEPICLPYPMLGLLEQPAQWIFDRKFVSQPNILSAIINNNTNTPEYSQDKLIHTIITQLNKYFPSLPKLIETKIIQEKRAAFLCTPTMQQLRPTNTTNIPNLFLAGDYTQGNYPSTIEGAVKSGINCAKLLQHR